MKAKRLNLKVAPDASVGAVAYAAWETLSPEIQEAIAAAVHIGPRVDTHEDPPLVWFPIGSVGVVLSAWKPGVAGRRALSAALTPRGCRWFPGPQEGKTRPKEVPAILDRAAWVGPLAGVIDACRQLVREGWTVAAAAEFGDGTEKIEAYVEVAPLILARMRVPGSSSRATVDAAATEAVSAEALAKAQAEFD